jgi:hypothetical protein
MLVKQRIKRKTFDNTRVQFEQRSFLFFIYLHSGVDMFFFVCVEGEESKVVEVPSMQSGKRKKRSDGAKFFSFFPLFC